MNIFRKKGVIFYIIFSAAILGWFSFSTAYGWDMLAWTKVSQGKELKSFPSAKHK